MEKIKKFALSNEFAVISVILALIILFWTYGCESKVRSMNGTGVLVTRPELDAEVEGIIALADVKYRQLQSQDALKKLLFDSLAIYAQTGTINPLGVLSAVLGLAAVGTTVDNVRKKKQLTTLNKSVSEKPPTDAPSVA